ncbi:HYR domain-containing protein [Corallococcus terminator]|uniref:HYR domain-containing protein n=1 Tax=Corallococcus terminator TaxID=2316733 RepID=A0A3A8JAI9_9BACT|nr:HYR domain-containing protein [Corallococcus terminator]RKG92847.1 HYR domain-containing protein [Corallococcus terminator]
MEAEAGDFLAQAEAALDGGGAVELESNVLKGTVRLTNANPQVLAMLATDAWRNGSGTVSATSSTPTGFGASTGSLVSVSPSEYRFEMLVEAGARGDLGVVYTVNATRGNYSFPGLSGVTVQPVAAQPAPTEVTLQSCIGVVEYQLGTDATCQTPATVAGVSVSNLSLHVPSTGLYRSYITPVARSATLIYRINTPTGPVLTEIPVQVAAGCDEVVRTCIPVTTPVPPVVGHATGAFEIHDARVLYSKSMSFSGPDSRSLSLPGPWSPVSSPATWWTVPNLPVGAYAVDAAAYLGTGRNFTVYNAPSLPSTLSITEGQTSLLTRQVGGVTRHAYDMHPAYFYGSVQLADPYMRQHPGAWSSLQALFFEADQDTNGDGVPNNISISAKGTYLSAVANGGLSYTAFPGTFNPSLGELASTTPYEQVLPSPYDLPTTWSQNGLVLNFWSEPLINNAFTTRPGLYDPARFRYGLLTTRSSAVSAYSVVLNPEQRFRIDHEYCFNEVQVAYSATLGRFFNPRADVSGSFSGMDWRNQSVSYVTSAFFYGTPAVWNFPNPATYAETSGQISLSLPQGTFTLRPSASMVSDSGTVNTASFAPIGVTLGCGQRIKLVPPLAVSLASLEGCATSDSKQVSGQVKSRPAEVDRIWYRLNDGPEVTLCTNCGFDPTFAFTVPLQTCDNSIQVFAYTEGMSEPASAVEQLVWDDAADGPSCPGSFCVNRPPVARCRNLTVAANGTCGGWASVNDGSYDPDTGDTVECVQTPAPQYPLGSHPATLTCTDSTGLSSSCEGTVTVRDETPPQLACAPVPEQECSAGGATVNLATTATDTCSTVTTTCTPVSGGIFPPGTTTATCTATDGAGNGVSCTVPVTVRDTHPPTITCPAPIRIERTGPDGATVTPGVATASDTCAPPQVTGPAAGTYPVGTTTVTYTATDVGGHQASCTSTIQVTDSQFTDPPNVTMCNLPRYTRETTLMACGWTTPQPNAAPVASASFRVDGGAAIPVTPDLSGGFVITWLPLAEGTHVIELTAIDTRGATTHKQMTVTVDLTPPVLTLLSPLPDVSLASPVVTVTSSVQDVSPTTVTTQWLQTSTVDSGTGQVNHTVDLFNRGFVPLMVTATDAAGNTTQLLTQVFIEPAPPAVLAQGPSASAR